MQYKKSWIWYKYNGFVRYFLAHSVTNIFQLYVVNEYPKSGGSWVGEMISKALDIPFPRNRLPLLRSSILHGHMMQSWNMNNVLLVWRDGRDVLISQYYHWLFYNDKGNKRLVERVRSDLDFSDYHDIKKNLNPFMEYVYEVKQYPKMSWADFVDKWVGCQKCVHVRYEDIRNDTIGELMRIVNQLAGVSLEESRAQEIVFDLSFENLSDRKVGEENKGSFLRKGVLGDWKNYFDREACQKFQGYAGNALVKLDYEKDDAWVYKCPFSQSM
jgi:hypothetical protein